MLHPIIEPLHIYFMTLVPANNMGLQWSGTVTRQPQIALQLSFDGVWKATWQSFEALKNDKINFTVCKMKKVLPVGRHLVHDGLRLGHEGESAFRKQGRLGGQVGGKVFRHSVLGHELEHGFEAPGEVFVISIHRLEHLGDFGRLSRTNKNLNLFCRTRFGVVNDDSKENKTLT